MHINGILKSHPCQTAYANCKVMPSSKSQDTLANQKLEEKLKCHIIGNGSYVWTGNEVRLLLDVTPEYKVIKTQENVI